MAGILRASAVLAVAAVMVAGVAGAITDGRSPTATVTRMSRCSSTTT